QSSILQLVVVVRLSRIGSRRNLAQQFSEPHTTPSMATVSALCRAALLITTSRFWAFVAIDPHEQTVLPNLCKGWQRYGLIVILFLTLTTPGTAQAARSASRRSAQVRTLPRRTTLPSFISTVIRLAS